MVYRKDPRVIARKASYLSIIGDPEYENVACVARRRLKNIGRAVLGNAEGARSTRLLTREARAARVSLFLHGAP